MLGLLFSITTMMQFYTSYFRDVFVFQLDSKRCSLKDWQIVQIFVLVLVYLGNVKKYVIFEIIILISFLPTI